MMRVWVNDKEVNLVRGMTVRQALIQVDLLQKIHQGAKVYDEWGYEMGLDGGIEEGIKIYVRRTYGKV